MKSFIPLRLRQLRLRRGWTLEVAADFMGTSFQHLARIESALGDPKLSSIERIANALGYSLVLVPQHRVSDVNRLLNLPPLTHEAPTDV